MGGLGQVVSPRYQDSRSSPPPPGASNSPPGAAPVEALPHGRRMQPAISFFRPLGMWSGPHSRAALVGPLTTYVYRSIPSTLHLHRPPVSNECHLSSDQRDLATRVATQATGAPNSRDVDGAPEVAPGIVEDPTR
ncbi:hypothetical protein OPV22_009190 [Ensete ventricosum]|uniref:Uncharacterized protein n=1 Tax=Ensete ventricosum TaxID=4639 RepID=A0AAV8R4M4_ENSVE|nr:hypothetical protein OPV22_009190 [Ensete ventricosum]